MGGVYEIDAIKPVIPASTFVHPDAVVIGDVIIGENCYIGPLCSLRGDFGRIVIGDGSDIQDGCVLHSFPNKDCTLENNSHVSHGAILHGCTIKPFGFVGMNAVVMDNAIIGGQAMVASMAFVKPDFVLPDRHLAAGTPAKIIREMDEQELTWSGRAPLVYQALTERCIKSLKPTKALQEMEADRPRFQTVEGTSKPLHESRKSEK